jgi:hypothetical protein
MLPEKLSYKLLPVLCSIFAFSVLFNTGFTCHHRNLQSEKDSIKVRHKILQFATTIAKENLVVNEHVGYAGGKSKRWGPFEKLCDSGTTLELRALTNYSNPAVRCYSFHALAIRKDTSIFSILLKHLLDTAQITVQNYDVIYPEMTGDYFIRIVTSEYIDSKAYKLNPDQRQKLDSILLYNKKVILNAKENLLSVIKPNTKYYGRIREIALKENNSVAVLALSRFRDRKDISIINKYLTGSNPGYYTVYAVREFPDNEFYPGLVQVFEKEWKDKLYDFRLWRMIYQALAQYPTAKTISLFERTIKTKDKYRYQTLGVYLVIAIKKYPSNLFLPIESNIRLEKDRQVDVDEGIKDKD